MARARGTTKRAGKVTNQGPAKVSGDRIEGPHRGKQPKLVGHQTAPEREDLTGIPQRRENSVRQVGPSDIRESADVGRSSSVRRVGRTANFEDLFAAQGGVTMSPGRRQGGSVKVVGPSEIGYQRLTERRYSPPLQTKQDQYRIKSGRKLDTGIPLLMSGAGRVHPWSVFAGSPGSKTGGVTKVKASSTGDTILINGRKRAFKPEGEDPRANLVTPSAATVLPGNTKSS